MQKERIKGMWRPAMAHLQKWLPWYCFLAFLIDFCLFTAVSIYHLIAISRPAGIVFSTIIIAIALVCMVKAFSVLDCMFHTSLRASGWQKVMPFLTGALFIIFCALYAGALFLRLRQPFGVYLLYNDVRLMALDMFGIGVWIITSFVRGEYRTK